MRRLIISTLFLIPLITALATTETTQTTLQIDFQTGTIQVPGGTVPGLYHMWVEAPGKPKHIFDTYNYLPQMRVTLTDGKYFAYCQRTDAGRNPLGASFSKPITVDHNAPMNLGVPIGATVEVYSVKGAGQF